MALRIFYNITDYEKIKISDVEYLINSINKVFNEKRKLTQIFTHNGIKYGLIPDFDYMTFGEFVDLDKFAADKDYVKLASILFRPIKKEQGKRYTIQNYKGANDDLKDMPLGIFLGVLDFFLIIGEQLLNATLNSLTQEEEMIKVQDSVKSGDGTQVLTHSQEAISYAMKELRGSLLINASLN